MGDTGLEPVTSSVSCDPTPPAKCPKSPGNPVGSVTDRFACVRVRERGFFVTGGGFFVNHCQAVSTSNVIDDDFDSRRRLQQRYSQLGNTSAPLDRLPLGASSSERREFLNASHYGDQPAPLTYYGG